MTADQLIHDPKCLVVCSHSGGKDSQAMYNLLARLIPDRDRLVVIHAHLPEVEWEGVREHIQSTITHQYYEVQAGKTFFEMVEHRGMFPSPQHRQCTSDLKRGPIRKQVKAICNEQGYDKVLDCMGLRAEESPARAKQRPFVRVNGECNSKREWYRWLPIHDWPTEVVFAYIKGCGQHWHWAYDAGMTRLSCCFCIMSSQQDLATAARLRPELFDRYVQTERRLNHTMMMPGAAGRKFLDEIVEDYKTKQHANSNR